MPATLADITVWRGDNAPAVIWQFPEGFTLGGSTFELTIFVGDAELLAISSEDGALVIDNEARQVIWLLTGLETVQIPAGRLAQYKLRRILVENRETLAYGAVLGQGGNPFDV